MICFRDFKTPLGPMTGASHEGKICFLEFTDRNRLDRQLASLDKLYGTERSRESTGELEKLQNELDSYFAGRLREFSLPLDYRGTPFQEKVWSELLKVPYGETRSYGDQARAMGDIKAVRAVASANGRNRIAILIPCHRIIGGDGRLTGYAGGLDRKARLLNLEKGCPSLF